MDKNGVFDMTSYLIKYNFCNDLLLYWLDYKGSSQNIAVCSVCGKVETPKTTLQLKIDQK